MDRRPARYRVCATKPKRWGAILTDEAVAGILAVHAGALVEVVDGHTERSLRTRTTDARMITVVDVARVNRFTDQIHYSPVYPQLYPATKRHSTPTSSLDTQEYSGKAGGSQPLR